MTDKMFNDIIDSIINNATPGEIEVIREKLNNYIINHIYDSDVHEELSNDFDSSFCPHCGDRHIIKHGKDKHNSQRFLCISCHKTFSAVTGTLFSYSKKKRISGIYIWNLCFVVIPLSNLLELPTYVNKHLLFGDIKFLVSVLLLQPKTVFLMEQSISMKNYQI